MSEPERDPHSGHMTTGHEWNGIKELNTPVPKPVFFFLGLTFCVAVALWLLLPAWPYWVGYTRGMLGIDQRKSVAERLEQAKEHAPGWMGKVAAEDFAAIQDDAELMRSVRQRGHELFGDNCAACHGRNGQGGKGFPALAANVWLWGGEPATIFETIRVGVNSSHPDTRTSQMPSFGKDQILQPDEIKAAVAYVSSLSGLPHDAALVDAGKEVFTNNCTACHGEDAKGSHDTGAPDLTDKVWLYGGDHDTIYRTVFFGRQGHMPRWDQRLSDFDRKVLALYVSDLARKGL